MMPAAFAALALLARTVTADRGNVALELTGGAHMKRVHRAHEIAAVKGQIRELQHRVDQLEIRELQDQVRAHQAYETAASQDRVRELQDRIRELHIRGLDVRELQEGRPIATNVDYGSKGKPGDKPATQGTAGQPGDKPDKPAAEQTAGHPREKTAAEQAAADATTTPATEQTAADAKPTQSGPSGSSELPKADALRELLDENNGPVVSSMKAADESAATLLDSAKQWKQSGEDIKKEFEESVQKEVLQTGKTLEEEHGGVKQEADEKPKKVLEELKQKHTASAPGGSGDSSSHTQP